MGRSKQHGISVYQGPRPNGQNDQMGCFFIQTCVRIFIFILLVTSTGDTELEEMVGMENGLRRARAPREAILRRRTIIAAEPLGIQVIQKERKCHLAFVPRWLLFVLVVKASLSWSAIQEPIRVLAGGVDPYAFAPIVGAIQKAVVALCEAVVGVA